MDDILQKGYAAEIDGHPGRLWYIPHHGVYHPHKPGKIRVVFDCSATYEGVSLNNVLLQGPNLTNNLMDILLRFRQENIAVMGDVESMFYRVRICEDDKDFQRFYWWPDGKYFEKPKVYRMLVHMFGTVSSPSCASYALRETTRDNRMSYSEVSCATVESKFYVDDCLFSTETEELAIDLVQEVTALCKEGGFRLTKWCSNSSVVMQSIPQEERAKDVKNLNLDRESLPNERVLGVYWFLENDMLGYKVNVKPQPDTRRGILSIISSVYDPLGIVAPFVLGGKQILQSPCKKGIAWDDKIDDVTMKLWRQWKDSLHRLEGIQVPRCYKPCSFGDVATCQLHVFADASESGYGVTVYMRLTNGNNVVHCALVMSKARVAPLKRITIPRLELTAATVAVRLSKVVEAAIEYRTDETFFWTDSLSVLRYISNVSTRFKTFVANRISVIRDGSDPKQWNHVPSKLNPADLASRGINIEKLIQKDEWFSGPDFLWKDQSLWPQTSDVQDTLTPDDDPEIKKPVCSTSVGGLEPHGLEKLICYYSSWSKLKRAVGWFLLLMTYLKQKKQRDTSERRAKVQFSLSTEVLEKAEQIIVRHVQSRHFQSELKELQNKNPPRISKSSPLSKLNPVLIDGIIRVGGRLGKAHIQYDAMHPIILPKQSVVSVLILNETHKTIGHLGRNSVLSQVRTKRIISKCITCRKYQAPPCQQMMSDFPEDRVETELPPFTNVGMDFFGPFLVKRGRASVKRYGVVFTCLNLRAIHLEVAFSLDTESCINAIRRFIARKGPPSIIRSDNGTNLVGAERELREQIQLLNKVKIHSSLLEKGVNWIFNPPLASHFGGIWERLRLEPY